MATKFYFHDAASPNTGTLPSSQQSTASYNSSATNADVNKLMDTTIGTAQVHSEAAASAGTQARMRRFLSAPLAAQTISGNFVLSGAAQHDNSATAIGESLYLGIWRPSTGAKVGNLYSLNGREWQGSTTPLNTQVAGDDISTPSTVTSLACLDGDILIAELGVFGAINASVFYDGTTEGSSSNNASYVSFANTISFFTTVTHTGSLTGDSEVTTVGRTVWTTPTDTSNIGTLPVLAFTMPSSRDKSMHFEMQIDTVSTFDSGNLRIIRSVVSQTGWEYFNGTSFVAVPSTGVPKANSGNAARYTVQSALTDATTYYRRVRTVAI